MADERDLRYFMGHDDYWVAISREGELLGGGFFVTSSYVLTSTACLPGLRAREPVDLHTARGLPLRAMVYELAEDVGLALVSVLPDPEADCSAPQADSAVKGDGWLAPYRPGPQRTVLRGTVDAVVPDRRDGEGRPLCVIELAGDLPSGDSEGYAGGPVERHTEGQDSAVIGILLDPEASGRLSETGQGSLAAGALSSAFEVFEKLSAEYLVGLLREGLPGLAEFPGTSETRADAAPVGPGPLPGRRAEASEVFETGRFMAREMNALAAENPLLARDMRPYYMRLANEVCDEAFRTVYGEPGDD
ncbi:hypothetical protein [Streptomyces marokkonensis]|uniref:hypothetical protein n=1 Tax=Streptomyces marokkonensis TaxID=324855 RepID=UPI0011F1E980|nr:hypothetical protein [Streptomyces marokkonensis]